VLSARRFSSTPPILAAAGALLALAALAVPASAATAPPPGAAKPTPGSGIGTQAALDNPRCVHDDPEYGVYGRFNSYLVGDGPVCVKPWKAGSDNGGTTSRGVTADRVTVVFVMPNEQQRAGLSAAAGTAPVDRATGAPGTLEDAVHDYMLPLLQYYETWGRDIDVHFVTSSGNDEAAQRADVVTITALEPFAVVDLITTGLDVLDAELAKAKILVWGAATTTEKALAQAPYRWGLSDAQASAINTAEVVGKQLVGRKAKFAGATDLQGRTRKFGAVFIPTLIDVDQFKDSFQRYGGTLTTENPYRSSGTTFGDDTLAQEQAPTIITKMKNAGVTTVILWSDVAMNRALTKQATSQDWHPEWFVTGALFQDLGLFARGYDQDQFAHAFGLSNLFPYTEPDPDPAVAALSGPNAPLNWYWGDGLGTTAQGSIPSRVGWVLNGIHAAGPNLTPKTFQQGLFSIPARGGAASGYTTNFLVGYGRTPGLPYDEYLQLGLDFAPMWWDSDTTGASNGTGTPGKGVARYIDGAKRYRSGTWPSKPFPWFEEEGTVVDFATTQPPLPVSAGDCAGCPSQGGSGQPGSPNLSGFVAKAGGQGAVAP
jgi:hypothetical protein